MDNAVYKQHQEVIVRQEEDDAILFNPDTTDMLVINSTGCLVWSLCDGRRTKAQILEAITAAYEVAPQTASQDLGSFLEDLKKRNFIIEQEAC